MSTAAAPQNQVPQNQAPQKQSLAPGLPCINNPRARSLHQQKVDAFMRLAQQNLPEQPEMCSEADRVLRAKIMMSEMFELIMDGLAVNIRVKPLTLPGASSPYVIQMKDLVFDISEGREPDLVLVADGVADVKVTATGTLSACGLADTYIQDLVDENNLAKFGPGGYRSDGSDGNPAGKWVKPPGHQPPDLVTAINLQLSPDAD